MGPGHQNGGGTQKIPCGQGNLERAQPRAKPISTSPALTHSNSHGAQAWVGGSPTGEDMACGGGGPRKGESGESGGRGEGQEAERTSTVALQGLKGEQVLLEGSRFPVREGCPWGMVDHLGGML